MTASAGGKARGNTRDSVKVRRQIGKGTKSLGAVLGPRSTIYVEKSRILLDTLQV